MGAEICIIPFKQNHCFTCKYLINKSIQKNSTASVERIQYCIVPKLRASPQINESFLQICMDYLNKMNQLKINTYPGLPIEAVYLFMYIFTAGPHRGRQRELRKSSKKQLLAWLL